MCVYAQLLSHIQLFATPWTLACQAHLSMEIFRQEYWTGLPFPSQGDSPNPGNELVSLASLNLLSCNLSLVSQSCLTFCDPHEV